jgi:hypothetical protein
MNAEYAISDDRSGRQVPEGIADTLPNFNAEFAFALVVKAVDLVEFARLMVSSEHEEV